MGQRLEINKNNLFKGIGISLTFALILTQSKAIARPRIFNSNYIEQYQNLANNPDDIIIDTNPGSTPPPPPVQTNSGNTRFNCQLDGGRYKVMY